MAFGLKTQLILFLCNGSDCLSKTDNPHLYKEAKGILNALKKKEVKMAIASRTHTPDIASVFLNKLGLTPLFVHMVSFVMIVIWF